MLYINRRQLANAIRIISIDSIQKANSGHPGMPMGMADIAEVLWNNHLKHNPNNPNWENRDRFIISNGHGSMLHYSLLHLTGYNLSIHDLKNFRQLESKTPGHPEYNQTLGIEATTGPLGQGLANAIGMAIAERILSAKFNRKNYKIIDHRIWTFVGDGCLMEGISHEVCSLAGTLGLGNLIVFYDNNGISIDGNTNGWFTDDTYKRFESYNWNVIGPINGHNAEEINKAIIKAKIITKKPSLIICNTIIGFGSPNKYGTSECHGAPLGDIEIKLVRKQLNWNYAPFKIPKKIYNAWNAIDKGNKLEYNYNKNFEEYKKKYPQLANELKRRYRKNLPEYLDSNKIIKEIQEKCEYIASRKASQNILNILGPSIPELLGGSADLTPSNLTMWKGAKPISKENFNGSYIHYGVREFGMGAISNGIAYHGGFIPYDATFLVFMEYMYNAIRMSAISKLHIIHVFTHDSIGLGEDGPTHQPIEQLEALRAIPELNVWRPADSTETAAAWLSAIENKEGPTAIILSRQELSINKRNSNQITNIKLGGYIIRDCQYLPDLIIIGSGSEVIIAIEAAKYLEKKNKKIRVVSMPCTSIFDKQKIIYRNFVLPPYIRARVAIEAGSPTGWYKYVGLDGEVLGINNYGYSGKPKDLFKKFGFTVSNLIKTCEKMLFN
ncbi:Transketolase [Candidatus Johnevansia muelleri]|uniref:Transketolase n=1 Tax=Candidatus Johnevansia muelleri TaxID=1495769 RepID=A0A078KER2_9GAMM|nr:Transketolase [Candidatus Evansia muelleri]